MRAGPVFLDTGIFTAFLDRSDHYHFAAVRLFADPPRRWYSSMVVVSETYGWFLHRLGEEAARTFRVTLADLPRLRLLAVDAAHHGAVCRKLDQFRGHKLTYVDASSLVLLQARGINEVWGTDADLGLEGARVFPIGPSE
ncbi:MAG: type II toxin-antitoxin system VapC family toxin [Acidobacteria bacterium]|nr:type II toxin-antitoxin system VapC family toxin [Acidobacteriota bacterium]